jgi:hypothetical protein
MRGYRFDIVTLRKIKIIYNKTIQIDDFGILTGEADKDEINKYF